jgi:hypothetical protein
MIIFKFGDESPLHVIVISEMEVLFPRPSSSVRFDAHVIWQNFVSTSLMKLTRAMS